MEKTQQKIPLVALETLANLRVKKGESFTASPEEARVLILAGRAKKKVADKAK